MSRIWDTKDMKFFFSLVIIALIISAGFIGFEVYKYLDQKSSLQFAPIVIDNVSSTSPIVQNIASSSTSIVTTSDTSKWKVLENSELGYSIRYPDDLIINKDELSLILAFPKKVYFHWPLLDDIKVTIVATSSCETKGLATITINDKNIFIDKVINDAAAGTIYKENSYLIPGNDSCYKIIINSKGSNGSSLYVDDPALIKKYDHQHDIDTKAVWETIYSIIYNFQIKEIPPGDIES